VQDFAMGQRRVSSINIMAPNVVAFNLNFKCSDCILLLLTAQWLFYVTVFVFMLLNVRCS